MIKILIKLFNLFSSVKLAIFIIIAMSVISAIGTFVESIYGLEYAQQLVYQSIWMRFTLGLLTVTLIAVMIDRLPWRWHHLGFLLAHVGILLILLGGWFTFHYGVDGIMIFSIPSKGQWVQLTKDDISVLSSFDGNNFSSMMKEPVNFYKKPPKKDNYKYSLGDHNFKILEFHPFVEVKRVLKKSESVTDPLALRFLMEGPFGTQVNWLRGKEGSMDFGPLKVEMLSEEVDVNSLKLTQKAFLKVQVPKIEGGLFRVISGKDNKIIQDTMIPQGETLELPFMAGFKFKVVQYYPNSYYDEQVKSFKKPQGQLEKAIKVKWDDDTFWVIENNSKKIFKDDKVFMFWYGDQRVPLKKPLYLESFSVDYYTGTSRAASYSSKVHTGDKNKLTTISMNEPLKWEGYTFYQSSYQEDDNGNPTHSVLSVNKDPGRFLKYLGSLLIVLGFMALFYFKKHYRRIQKLFDTKKQN